MRRSLRTLLALSTLLMLSPAGSEAEARSPRPLPDVIDPSLCKPARMAIVKEREGRLRSAKQWAIYGADLAIASAQDASQRFWDAYKKEWLAKVFARSAKAGAKPAPAAAPAPAKKRPADYAGDDGMALCKGLASRSMDFCKKLGDGEVLCRALLTAAGGKAGCSALGKASGACEFILGGPRAACDGGAPKGICDLIARARDKRSLKSCTRDDPSGGCGPLAFVAGIGGDAQACDRMAEATERELAICRAVVSGKPAQCGGVPDKLPPPVEPERLKPTATVNATLLGQPEGPPRVLIVAETDHPAVCHIDIRSGATPVWSGTMRVPEDQSTRTVAEHPIADAKVAQKVDPVGKPALTAKVSCMPRFYW